MPSDERGLVRVEPSAKRVRGFVDGHVVFDTVRPLLVWENPSFPAYYIPEADVTPGVLTANGKTTHSPSRGDATGVRLEMPTRTIDEAGWTYRDSPIERLRSLVRFEWGAMDAWFEEDEEVFVHPRSPYARVDILASSRHVRVEINGVTVADSVRTRLLFETGLPTRYYFPPTDVRMDLLRPSATLTRCPYKGTASYHSLELDGEVITDAVWTYKAPVAESQKIAGLMAFYNERVDLYVDGELQERPRTHF